MRRCWLCLGLVAGCGRYGFSGRSAGDGAVDGVTDAVAADAAICHSGAWGTPQPIAIATTSSQESDPSISPDELTLYFLSNRAPSQGRAIWRSTRNAKTDPFGTPSIISELDSPQDDGEPEISADGLTLYFWSFSSGSNLIYYATQPTAGGTFTNQGQLVITGGGTQVSGPSISSDELTLFFAHDLDIGYATRSARTDSFTFVRVLPEVDVPASDGNPSVTADGLELFFDSYRNGPATIFVATRGSTTSPFTGPTELPELKGGYPAAGTPEISADGRTLYYFINNGTQIDLYTSTRDCL